MGKKSEIFLFHFLINYAILITNMQTSPLHDSWFGTCGRLKFQKKLTWDHMGKFFKKIISISIHHFSDPY